MAGPDRASYLQGLLTNDIQALTPGTGCYAAWLTPQGRMLTDMHVLESGDMILLDLPADQVQATLARLDQFLFSENVQLADLSANVTSIWIHGPEAARIIDGVVSGLDDVATWAEYRNARGEFSGAPVSVARISQLAVPGYVVYVEAAREQALVESLVREGAVELDRETIEAARIEAGYPVFGADMNDDIIPLEAGIESRAISLTKGCYVGQEIIIRVLHRGQGRVARRLVRLSVTGSVPAAGAKILAGDKDIGVVTSAAASPRLGPVALGYVHRDFVAPGTVVEIDSGTRLSATVKDRVGSSVQ